jgi:bifunctional DNase/RNase
MPSWWSTQEAREVEIDARSSDAIALALRFDCPIFTYEFILGAAGLKVEEGEEEQPEGGRTEGAKANQDHRDDDHG